MCGVRKTNHNDEPTGMTALTVLLPNVNRQKMSPPIIKPVKKKFFINGIRGDLFGYQHAT